MPFSETTPDIARRLSIARSTVYKILEDESRVNLSKI
ncbi:helix-turn-helix domain-containing protein [Raoultella planticola]